MKSWEVILKYFLNIVKQQKNLSIQVLFILSNEVWILLSLLFIALGFIITTSLSATLLNALIVSLCWFVLFFSTLVLVFFSSFFGAGLISIFWLLKSAISDIKWKLFKL